MFTSIKAITLLILVSCSTEGASVKKQLQTSHDTFIRKDATSRIHGNAPKITVTQTGSNQRIGLIQFDTSDLTQDSFDSNNIKAHLQLSVAETHQKKPVQVRILKLKDTFDEHATSWDNFSGDATYDNSVQFTVDSNHINRVGEVDVSKLIKPGDHTALAIVIEDEGHVKFYSKDIGDGVVAPTLILTYDDEL